MNASYDSVRERESNESIQTILQKCLVSSVKEPTQKNASINKGMVSPVVRNTGRIKLQEKVFLRTEPLKNISEKNKIFFCAFVFTGKCFAFPKKLCIRLEIN